MPPNSSFDISTGADLQEVDNAVNNAVKEIAQRARQVATWSLGGSMGVGGAIIAPNAAARASK